MMVDDRAIHLAALVERRLGDDPISEQLARLAEDPRIVDRCASDAKGSRRNNSIGFRSPYTSTST
jgi:hypothetical protein